MRAGHWLAVIHVFHLRKKDRLGRADVPFYAGRGADWGSVGGTLGGEHGILVEHTETQALAQCTQSVVVAQRAKRPHRLGGADWGSVGGTLGGEHGILVEHTETQALAQCTQSVVVAQRAKRPHRLVGGEREAGVDESDRRLGEQLSL